MSFTADSTTNKKLDGKWCVITGGGQGVGQAIAETFAAEGASIALVARSKDKLDKVTKRKSVREMFCNQKLQQPLSCMQPT